MEYEDIKSNPFQGTINSTTIFDQTDSQSLSMDLRSETSSKFFFILTRTNQLLNPVILIEYIAMHLHWHWVTDPDERSINDLSHLVDIEFEMHSTYFGYLIIEFCKGSYLITTNRRCIICNEYPLMWFSRSFLGVWWRWILRAISEVFKRFFNFLSDATLMKRK